MPLSKRSVSPAQLNIDLIPEEIKRDELQYLANRTIANLIRQLDSLSAHAEHVFGEIYTEALRLNVKVGMVTTRMERLQPKLNDLESGRDEASIDYSLVKKAFKSSSFVDQRTLDRETLPSALHMQYEKCTPPPNLDALNVFRVDRAENGLSLYTNPSFFFDLWRQEMLKECNVEQVRRAPAEKRRSARKEGERGERKEESQWRLLSSHRPPNNLSFPDEYQAPSALGILTRKEWTQEAPVGMHRPVAAAAPRQHHGGSGLRALAPMASSGGGTTPLMDGMEGGEEDESLPPPPPQLVASSPLTHTHPPIQLIHTHAAESAEGEALPAAPPPPPPPPPLPPQPSAVPSFAPAPNDASSSKPLNERSNLMAEIHAGIKLKKVRQEEEAVEEKNANDVAAILRKRMQQVYGEESSEEEEVDESEWE